MPKTDPRALLEEAVEHHSYVWEDGGASNEGCEECGATWPCLANRLAAALRVALEDSERLDAVDAMPPSLVIQIARAFRDSDAHEDADIRAAIDAARKEPKG